MSNSGIRYAMTAVLASIPALPVLASAEVVSAAPDHVAVRVAATTAAPPAHVWARLVEPARWWSASHTWSGDAGNLELEPWAGGQFRETWPRGSVEHGRVVFVDEGKLLRLNAPLGPLQGMAVTAEWTIELAPADGGGTTVTFDFVINGASKSGLDQLAPGVDAMMTQTIGLLAAGG